MILYCVDLEVDTAIYPAYLAWLREHVDGMLALPGFLGADIFERVEPRPAAGRQGLVVHYRLTDMPAWQDYQTLHAPRMREAGVRRFGARFHAIRSILRPLE